MTDVGIGHERLSAESPYPGLQPFGEEDSGYFHGRRREADELYRLVRRAILTTCFGKSGLGKTSLLNAALFPRLRADGCLPIRVRFDFGEGRGSLTGQIKDCIARALVEGGVDGPRPDAAEPLWQYFHRAVLWDRGNHPLLPVLVLDQAEELFTLGHGDPRVRDLVVELADLVENQVPAAVREALVSGGAELAFGHEKRRFKVVLSLREDYLADLEGLRRLIPSLGQNRFRLTELNGAQALEAVVGPAGGIVSTEVASAIVRFAAGAGGDRREPAGGEDLERLDVEPALLALVCRKLNDRRLEQRAARITGDMLQGERGRIYHDFYEESLRGLSPAARRFVEERLITASGFRTAAATEEALRQGVTERDLSTLVDRRMLRVEPRLGIPHVELIHDVLASVVMESRTERREAEGRKRRAKRLRRMAGGVAVAVVLLAAWAIHESRLRSRAVLDRVAAEHAERRALAALRQAEGANSFVFDLSEQLRGLGRPDLFGRISLYLTEYARGLDADRDGDLAVLAASKVLYFDGLASLERGDNQRARELFGKYLDVVENARARGQRDLWRLEAAKTREVMGDLFQAERQPRAAAEQYGTARDLLLEVRAPDNVVEHGLLLSRILSKLGEALAREDEYDRALAAYGEAREHLERLARGERPNPVLLQALADVSARITTVSPWVGRSAPEKDQDLAFVHEFMRRCEGPAVEPLLELYADSVSYHPDSPYGRTDADRAFIADDKRRYFKKWPSLKYTLVSDVEVVREGDLKVLRFRYAFDAFNRGRGRYLLGEADNTLKVREDAAGAKIVLESQQIVWHRVKE